MKTFTLAMLGLMLVLASLCATGVESAYVLEDTYSGTTFFDNFDFVTDDDPTPDTYVNYVDRPTAQGTHATSYAHPSAQCCMYPK
jgi:hypothetical protein